MLRGGVYSNTSLPQEIRNISNKNLTLNLNQLSEEQKNPKLVERNYKGQTRNKWKVKEKITKDQ